MTEDPFAWWKNALAGTRGPISADDPQPGFYRQKRKDGTFEPVAYWLDSGSGEMRCHVNGKSPDAMRMMEIWPYASRNPITEAAYWHRMDTGQWLDNDTAAADVAKGPEIDPATDPVGSMRQEIEKAKAGAASYSTVDSDEQAAKAQTLRSALTALAGKADKARKKEKDPHLEASKAVDAKWQPLVKSAQDAADAIRAALSAWETLKLENQRRADEENRKLQEQAAKDKEWADAGNEPPPATPQKVAPNTPPPATQIKGASGRTATVGIRKVVKSIDLEKAFLQFGGLPEVYQMFMALAQKAVDAGRDVPCAEIREEANVR